MASESLEKAFATNQPESLPSGSFVNPIRKENIKQEGFALKAIERRRQTYHQGRVRDQFSVWGAAEDSIISQTIHNERESQLTESPSPTKQTHYLPSREPSELGSHQP